MFHRVKGFAFRLTGLILGIIGTVVSVTSIVFSGVGMAMASKAAKKAEEDKKGRKA